MANLSLHKKGELLIKGHDQVDKTASNLVYIILIPYGFTLEAKNGPSSSRLFEASGISIRGRMWPQSRSRAAQSQSRPAVRPSSRSQQP